MSASAKAVPLCLEEVGDLRDPVLPRRLFLAGAGGLLADVVLGIALPDRHRVEGAAPPPVARKEVEQTAGFLALIWVINRAVTLPVPVRASDFCSRRFPRPTDNAFHDSFAAPVEMVSVGGKPFTSELQRRCKADLQTFLLPYDVNYSEALQIKKEYEAGLFARPLVPITKRYPPRDKHRKAVQRAGALYGLSPREFQARYINLLTDNRKVECYGVGVKVGAKERFLIVTE